MKQKNLTMNQVQKLIRTYEREMNEEITRVLIRVFKKAAHKAWVEGDMKRFRQFMEFLDKVREP